MIRSKSFGINHGVEEGALGERGILSTPLLFVNPSASNAHFVDTAMPGFTNTAQGNTGPAEDGRRSGTGDTRSPRPVTHAVGPKKKNGTSLPSVAPSSANRARDHPRFHRRLRPISTVAASLLPPPSPAPRGMRLTR